MGHELTKNDIKKMEEEIEYRIHEVRKAALDDVKETRAQGDLSENFEYHAAKRFKNKNLVLHQLHHQFYNLAFHYQISFY